MIQWFAIRNTIMEYSNRYYVLEFSPYHSFCFSGSSSYSKVFLGMSTFNWRPNIINHAKL